MDLTNGEFAAYVIFAALWATLLFWHADRAGNQRATAWGIAGFFFGIFAAAVYFARYWRRGRRPG